MSECDDEEFEKIKQIQDDGLASMKEYYIAYLDILGYKDFFRNRKNEIQLLFKVINEQIQEIVSTNWIFRYVPNIRNIDFQVKRKIFSDNLLFCLEKNDGKGEKWRLLMFVMLVAYIQRRCLRECGILLRGGITQGEMLFNSEFVFGEGVINAVEMEETAKHPRVAVSKEVFELMSPPYDVTNEQLRTLIQESANGVVEGEGCGVTQDALYLEFGFAMIAESLISVDTDGCLFVNYLNSNHCQKNKMLGGRTLLLMLLLCKEEDGWEKVKQCAYPNSYYLESMKKIKGKIIEALMKYGHCDSVQNKKEASKKVIEKYLWTLVHYNNVCIAYGLNENMIDEKEYI